MGPLQSGHLDFIISQKVLTNSAGQTSDQTRPCSPSQDGWKSLRSGSLGYVLGPLKGNVVFMVFD